MALPKNSQSWNGYGSNPKRLEQLYGPKWRQGTFIAGSNNMPVGAGLFGQPEQQLEAAKAFIGLAGIGDVGQAGQRAYTFGREEEELGRLRMAAEGRKLQSQLAFQPQMEAIRGGIMGRMAGRLNVGLPSVSGAYSSGTGYTPSWMQNYQPPQFPR